MPGIQRTNFLGNAPLGTEELDQAGVDHRKIRLVIFRLNHTLTTHSNNPIRHFALGLAHMNLHSIGLAMRCSRTAQDLNPALSMNKSFENFGKWQPALEKECLDNRNLMGASNKI